MHPALAALLGALAVLPALAAPYTPTTDAQVLERLPARAADPRMQSLRALRERLAQDPQDAEAAVQLARGYFDLVAAEGDPRYIGYAQAALAPWWDAPDPPPRVRVMRALLLQFGHAFGPALQDLEQAARALPDDGEAWSWQAAIFMVQARYAEARRACEQMAPLASPLIATACIAGVDGVTGRATAAAEALRAALAADRDASPPEQLWALTRLAEIEERRGAYPEAEDAFRRALALGITDGYLLAAYADFLLDRGRAQEVLALLKDGTRSDLLLLRLAIAAKAANAPQATAWADELGARFDAARLRGDTVHQKEEARYLLALRGDAQRALPLAQANFAVQREPADARVLLEAALAARQPAAAAPALQWMNASKVQSAALGALAARLQGGS